MRQRDLDAGHAFFAGESGGRAVACPGATRPVNARVAALRVVEIEGRAFDGRGRFAIVRFVHLEAGLVPNVGHRHFDGVLRRVFRGDLYHDGLALVVQPILFPVLRPGKGAGHLVAREPLARVERFRDGIGALGQKEGIRFRIAQRLDGRQVLNRLVTGVDAGDGELGRVKLRSHGIALEQLGDLQIALAVVHDEDIRRLTQRLAEVNRSHLKDDGIRQRIDCVGRAGLLGELIPAGHQAAGADHAVFNRGVRIVLVVGHAAPAAIRGGIGAIGLILRGEGLKLDVELDARESLACIVHLGEAEAALARVTHGDGMPGIIAKAEGGGLRVDPVKVRLFRLREIAAHEAGFHDGVLPSGGQQHFDIVRRIACARGVHAGADGDDRALGILLIERDRAATLLHLQRGRDLIAIHVELFQLQRAVLHVVDSDGLAGVDGRTIVSSVPLAHAALVIRGCEFVRRRAVFVFVFVARGQAGFLPIVGGVLVQIEARAAVRTGGKRLDVFREAFVRGNGDFRARERFSGGFVAMHIAVLFENHDDLVGEAVDDGTTHAIFLREVAIHRVVARHRVVLAVGGDGELPAIGRFRGGVARPGDFAEPESGAVFAIHQALAALSVRFVHRIEHLHRIRIFKTQSAHIEGLGNGAPRQIACARHVYAGGEGGYGFQLVAIRVEQHEFKGGVGQIDLAGHVAFIVIRPGDLIQFHLHIADDAGASDGDVLHLETGVSRKARPAVRKGGVLKARGSLNLQEGIDIARAGKRRGDQPAIALGRGRAGFINIIVHRDGAALAHVFCQYRLNLRDSRVSAELIDIRIDRIRALRLAAVEEELGAVEVDLGRAIHIVQRVVVLAQRKLRIRFEVDQLRALGQLRAGGEIDHRGAVSGQRGFHFHANGFRRICGEIPLRDDVLAIYSGGSIASAVAQLNDDILRHAVQSGEAGHAAIGCGHGVGLAVRAGGNQLQIAFFIDLINGQRRAVEREFARVPRIDFPLAVGVLLHGNGGFGHVGKRERSAIQVVGRHELRGLRGGIEDIALGRAGFRHGVVEQSVRAVCHVVNRQAGHGGLAVAARRLGGEDIVPVLQFKA